MARFLSREWIADVADTALAHPGLSVATAGVRLVVQQVVTGGSHGDVHYVVSIDDGRVLFREGDDHAADVCLVVDWDTAVGMATGAVGGQEAFTTGRMKLQGDVSVLLRHGPALAGLDAVFAAVRERTTY